MSAAPVTSGRRRFRLVILGLSVLLSLAAVEAVFRFRAWQLNYESLDGAFARQPEVSPRGRVRFIDIIQPNPNDKIVYELRPDLDTEYSGCKLTTNGRGFRMPEFPPEQQPGMVTVVGLGGSIMFGHGVADGEDFFSVLGRLLADNHPERSWRCINMAVPSYNVVMKVETLKEKGLQLDPDLVVLGIASNNLDLPNDIRIEEDPYDLGRSFILDYFDELRGLERESDARYAELAHVDKPQLSWGSINAVVTTDPARIPPRYRDLVGWDPFYRALDELKSLSLEHGFQVVVVANLDYDLVGAMLDAAAERGFQIVLTQDEIDAWIKKTYNEPFSIERYCQSELVVNSENLHPSVMQHKLIGRRLAYELWQRGLIGRLLEKVPKAP